jgi:phage-related protein
MTQLTSKKQITVDKRADKELSKFPRVVQAKFKALFEFLKKEGRLEEPDAKKLLASKNLFEVRVKNQGAWRSIYAYGDNNHIIILSAFNKKKQKTPKSEINKALTRLAEYQ